MGAKNKNLKYMWYFNQWANHTCQMLGNMLLDSFQFHP